MRAFYFGCVRDPGHYYWTQDLRRAGDAHLETPWGYGIDMADVPVGYSVVLHKRGWSALVIGDRSVDTRPGSISAFVFEQPGLDEVGLWRLARACFPSITARLERAGVMA